MSRVLEFLGSEFYTLISTSHNSGNPGLMIFPLESIGPLRTHISLSQSSEYPYNVVVRSLELDYCECFLLEI